VPRPRFLSLPRDKRERILLAAGKAFAKRGYDGATINHILGQADISTGAAYYYFDNKADLFLTALTFHVDLLLASGRPELEAPTPEAFWIEFFDAVGESMGRANEVHRTVAALRAAWKNSPELSAIPDIAEQFGRNEALLRGYFRRGREVGAIRTDLPDTLLLRCALALDEAFDDWLEAESKVSSRQLGRDELTRLMQPMASMLRSMFAPPEEPRR
jgi:AcrR family transcriptional regulator